MLKNILENYIQQNIPLVNALGAKVEYASLEKVIITAPLASNINDKKTIFGGSLHAIATLSCWGLLYVNLRDITETIVINHSTIDYLVPIDTAFKAECTIPDIATWDRFIKMLTSKKKARIQLASRIFHKEKLAVDYHGIFVATK